MSPETFRAFRALPKFRREAKFSSWLYRIALNLCRDWARRERRTPVVQAPEDTDLMDLATASEPSEPIEHLVARNDPRDAPSRSWRCCCRGTTHGHRAQEATTGSRSRNCGPPGCPLSTVKTRVVSGTVGVASRTRTQPRQGGVIMTTDTVCTFGDRREDVLIAYLYDDIDTRDRAFRASPRELCGLPARSQRSSPTSAGPGRVGRPGGGRRHWRSGAACGAQARRTSRRTARLARAGRRTHLDAGRSRHAGHRGIPGLANINLTYSRDGLSVTTGGCGPHRHRGSTPDANRQRAAAPATDAPWRAELTALEQQLRSRARHPSCPGCHRRRVVNRR